jgi:hypothetical protein
MDKSVFEKTQRIESLGYIADTVRMVFEIKQPRIDKFVAAAATVEAACELVGTAWAKDVACCVGHLASMSLVLGRSGTLSSRYITDAISDTARHGRWNTRIAVSAVARAELRAWVVRLRQGVSASIVPFRRPPATTLLCSDAGAVGYGGHVVGAGGGVCAHDVFTAVQRTRSSTWRELFAVLATLKAFVDELVTGSAVDIQVDSLCAAQGHAKGGSLSRDTSGRLLNHELISAIEAFCASKAILLTLVWVPRAENQRADDESKIVDVFNYALCRAQFQSLSDHWGPFGVDRFASAANALLPVFHSRWACPGSSGVDAFRSNWGLGGVNNWLHPPTPLIASVLAKMRADRAIGTILVPWTSYATWWPLLYPSDGPPSPVLEWFSFSPTEFVEFEPNTRASGGRTPWSSCAFRLDFRHR